MPGRPREEEGDDAVVDDDEDNAADDDDDVFAVADVLTWAFAGRKSSAPGIIARLVGCSR